MTDKRQRLDSNQVGGDHYSKMEITPWEFLQSCLTAEEFRGYLKGEAIVYIARELSKAGPTDIGKARHVLQKLEEVYPVPPKVEVPEYPPGFEPVKTTLEYTPPGPPRTPLGRCWLLQDDGSCANAAGCQCPARPAGPPTAPPTPAG